MSDTINHSFEDLTDLNFADTADQGATMTVMHPVKRTPLIAVDGKPIGIRLVGIDSDIYQKNNFQGRDANVEELRRRAKFSSASDHYKGGKLLAKCTLDWHGIVQGWIDGSKDNTVASFSYENALALYNNRGVNWLREQVDEFIADRANFLKS